MNAVKGMKGFQPQNAVKRFWEKVDKSHGENACWIWTGCKNHPNPTRAYGQFWLDGKTRPAHRISWEWHHKREMPSHLDACHKCDNPSCVNPRHIWAGTKSENMSDSVSKNRHYNPVEWGHEPHQKSWTHCMRGHPLEGDNLRITAKGWRTCRICQRVVQRRSDAKRRAKRREALATKEADDA